MTLAIRGRQDCSVLLSRARPRHQDYLHPAADQKKRAGSTWLRPVGILEILYKFMSDNLSGEQRHRSQQAQSVPA